MPTRKSSFLDHSTDS